MKKTVSHLATALAAALILTGCSSPSSTEVAETPEAKPALQINSDGWNCEPALDSASPHGSCALFTFANEDAEPNPEEPDPFAVAQLVCQAGKKPSTMIFYAGSDFTNEMFYKWNPAKYPTLHYSLDQGPRKEIRYDIKAANGRIDPEVFDIDQNPDFVSDLAGATTLQIWVNDYKGVERELRYLVKDSVVSVGTLVAWGLACNF
jgi:hypothetical protein